MIVAIYVDDLRIATKDSQTAESWLAELRQFWDTTDASPTIQHLGLGIAKSQRGNVLMFQTKMILESLRRFNLEHLKNANVAISATIYPMDMNNESVEEQRRMAELSLRAMVGTLIWIATKIKTKTKTKTRPDIITAVSVVAQTINSPSSRYSDTLR